MNFISRIIKSINAMRERLKIERHEAMYGPHFNEECALKAVSKMENEDGSRGEHWSLEETTSIANQYGINLKGEKYNKYDWYVALNMIRSDYYRAVVTMTSSDHIKYFVELAKAWLNDKDIEEGKMWYYYCYIMCDKLRKEAKTMLMLEDDEDEEREYRYARGGRGRGRGRGGRMTRYGYDYDEDDEYLDREREEERMHRYEPIIVLVLLLRFQILMMRLYLKVSFQYQDRTDVNQSMYLLVVMENLRNYQYQLSVRSLMILLQDLLLLLIKKKQLIWLDRTIMSSKLKKKLQVSMMKKWRSVKIFQINQKHRQKLLQQQILLTIVKK